MSFFIVSIFGPRLPFPITNFSNIHLGLHCSYLLGFVVGPEGFLLPPAQSPAKLKSISTWSRHVFSRIGKLSRIHSLGHVTLTFFLIGCGVNSDFVKTRLTQNILSDSKLMCVKVISRTLSLVAWHLYRMSAEKQHPDFLFSK